MFVRQTFRELCFCKGILYVEKEVGFVNDGDA